MEEKSKKKIDRCRFSDYGRKDERICEFAGLSDDKIVQTDEAKCENCPNFKSRYIEFPITVNTLELAPLKYNDSWHCKVGTMVAVRPCGEEYGKKTYLGFYLGDLPIQMTARFNEKDGALKCGTLDNPAMFVPELGKIIWGCGSWWHEIKSEKDLEQITDADINNTWYVQLAKKLAERNKEEEK